MKSGYEFRAIDMNDVLEMTELLIGRQNLESEEFPFLTNRCLNAEYIAERLRKLLANTQIIGVGARINGALVGYIFGAIEKDSSSGRYASVSYEGIAIRRDQSPELIKYLYSKVSVLWLEQGCFEHVITVPIGSRVYYEMFLQLSFAIVQVHAVMNVAEYKPFKDAADVEVRRANAMDREAMGRMSSIIAKHHNAAPVFKTIFPEVLASRKEGFKKLVDEENDIVLIAEKDTKELGFQDYEILTPHLMAPDDGIELCLAGTYSSQMGRGVGKKLMNEGCRIVKELGYSSIATDWRIANLASSSFWTQCGFKPITYRMVRHIDIHYAWANFDNPSIKNA